MMDDLDRCDREIAEARRKIIEEPLSLSDTEGALLAIQDWMRERDLILQTESA